VTTITLLGLGEAGRLYASGLAEAGAQVFGYDPFVTTEDASFQRFSDIADAVRDADIVISLVGAKAAAGVAAQALPRMRSSAVLADFNTSSPTAKLELALVAGETGILFADVAVLAPVPRAGSKTPLMVSGTGAEVLRGALVPLGVPIESIAGEAGDAASRKLLRSVFMKGLAGVVLETAEAGRLAGNEGWVRDQMAAELGPDGHAFVERLITGSRAHADRRKHEIQDALDYIQKLGVEGWMAAGALEWLTMLAEDNARTDNAS